MRPRCASLFWYNPTSLKASILRQKSSKTWTDAAFRKQLPTKAHHLTLHDLFPAEHNRKTCLPAFAKYCNHLFSFCEMLMNFMAANLSPGTFHHFSWYCCTQSYCLTFLKDTSHAVNDIVRIVYIIILDQVMTCRWKNYQAKYSNRNVNIYKQKVDVKFKKSLEWHLYFYVPEKNVGNVPVNQKIDYSFN